MPDGSRCREYHIYPLFYALQSTPMQTFCIRIRHHGSFHYQGIAGLFTETMVDGRRIQATVTKTGQDIDFVVDRLHQFQANDLYQHKLSFQPLVSRSPGLVMELTYKDLTDNALPKEMREEFRELGEIRVRMITGSPDVEAEFDCSMLASAEFDGTVLASAEIGPVQETWKRVTVERAVTWVLAQIKVY